jgi:hypothetical protein
LQIQIPKPPVFRALQAAWKAAAERALLPGIILLRAASAQHVRQVSPLRRDQISSADLQRLQNNDGDRHNNL